MKSKLLIGAVAFVALGVFGVALLQQPQPTPTQTLPAQTNSAASDQGLGDTSQPQQPQQLPQAGTYTMAQVQQHNSGSSCWTAINGKVYDVTNWIDQHPGGTQAILSLCGTDGSSAFNNQHGGQRRPESELASFLIGTLAS
jgi:cytochrome b involved in lipid metabolism